MKWTPVFLTLAVLVVTTPASAQSHLSFADGKAAITRYNRHNFGGMPYTILRCQRRSAISIACLLFREGLRGGEWIDADGTVTPAETDLQSWSVAKLKRNCVKVWEPIFRLQYARCLPI